MQRPFFSQSPKRVGSGPAGPPISRGASAPATSSGLGMDVGTGAGSTADAGRPTPWGSFCIAG